MKLLGVTLVVHVKESLFCLIFSLSQLDSVGKVRISPLGVSG